MLPIACVAQDYRVFTEALLQLRRHPEQANAWWQERERQGQIPFTCRDSVAFLYRGQAESVVWMGDFNGWGYAKSFPNAGTRIPGTDIWMLKTTFPINARLDYKILVNQTQWMLDPANPFVQWSGVGGGSPNSELRMPGWKPDAIAQTDNSMPAGQMVRDQLLNSKVLGYQITYSLYLPPGYTPKTEYPVLYITDGYEYLHEQMGNMPAILNNLIGTKRIQPILAVFVDHREPINRANNKRMQELAMNEQYLKFFAEELIPAVEGRYFTQGLAARNHGILGTSMGGLTAAYFAFSRPDLFGLAGIQSPAFWFKPQIYQVCDNPDRPPVRVYLTTGVIHDTEEGAEKMKSILEKNTCTFQYQEVNQGHSWGNWRDLIDDILIYFFGTK